MARVQPQSDVAALWQEALDGYKKITDIDLLGRSEIQRSVNSIMVSNALRRRSLFLSTCLERRLRFWRRHYLNATITSLKIYVVASLWHRIAYARKSQSLSGRVVKFSCLALRHSSALTTCICRWTNNANSNILQVFDTTKEDSTGFEA
jgi:hypothetical protein